MNIIGFKEINILDVVLALRSGQTVVYPTETCYGLGCDATNEAAVEQVFAIKGRERTKSVLMIAADIEMVKRYVIWNETIEALAKKYWPGALTMVLPVREGHGLAPGVIFSDNTVAFRVSAHPFAHELAVALGRPLVSTSANIAGGPNPYTIAEVVEAFCEQPVRPDILIDAGELSKRPPSTIVRVRDGNIEVLRQGDLRIV